MTARSPIHRVVQTLSVACAGLALAAPAASALPADAGPFGWPPEPPLALEPVVTPTTMESLTEREVLASRGQGAPRAVAQAGDPAVEPEVILGGATLAVVTLSGLAFTVRRRAKVLA